MDNSVFIVCSLEKFWGGTFQVVNFQNFDNDGACIFFVIRRVTMLLVLFHLSLLSADSQCITLKIIVFASEDNEVSDT